MRFLTRSSVPALSARWPGITGETSSASNYIASTRRLPASGWLIEQCGFKGQLLHGMRASSKTALILINESARSYHDLAAARAEIRIAVQKQFGFVLEQEPEEMASPLQEKPNVLRY